MRLFTNLNLGNHFTFSFGWFKGQQYKLFNFSIFDKVTNDCLSIINIQILKFVFELCWFTYNK